MLTREQVNTAAKTSENAALESSIEHWWENIQATEEELLEAETDPIGWYMCALCVRHATGCALCLLAGEPGLSCDADSPYDIATNAYIYWRRCQTAKNWQTWRRAAETMHKVLCGLRKRHQHD